MGETLLEALKFKETNEEKIVQTALEVVRVLVNLPTYRKLSFAYEIIEKLIDDFDEEDKRKLMYLSFVALLDRIEEVISLLGTLKIKVEKNELQ